MSPTGLIALSQEPYVVIMRSCTCGPWTDLRDDPVYDLVCGNCGKRVKLDARKEKPE